MTGKVYLVGAGPGDPGLITVKGMRALEQAQVVVYDRLVDPSLLQAVPATAERVFVGKERGRQELSQERINQLLVDRALQGLTTTWACSKARMPFTVISQSRPPRPGVHVFLVMVRRDRFVPRKMVEAENFPLILTFSLEGEGTVDAVT